MADPRLSAGAYPVYESLVSTASASFKKNQEEWLEVMQTYEDRLKWAMSEGDDIYVKYICPWTNTKSSISGLRNALN